MKMAKPKRTIEKRHVRLIKHLLNNRGMEPLQISMTTGILGRSGISHIKHERRWYDIKTPSYIVGEYLYFLHKNGQL